MRRILSAYHVMQGIDEIIPVDVYHSRLPAVPEAVLDAVIKLQETDHGGHASVLRTASAPDNAEEAGNQRHRRGSGTAAAIPDPIP
jgi:NADH:ubiquinone oxidoreductase subunit B-like Fe-S oxidoreductase